MNIPSNYVRKLIVLDDGKILETWQDPTPMFTEQHIFLPFGWVFWIREARGIYSWGFRK